MLPVFLAALAGSREEIPNEMKFFRGQSAAVNRRGKRTRAGTASTRNPASDSGATTRSPGSLMPGVPASVTRETFPRRAQSRAKKLFRSFSLH